MRENFFAFCVGAALGAGLCVYCGSDFPFFFALIFGGLSVLFILLPRFLAPLRRRSVLALFFGLLGAFLLSFSFGAGEASAGRVIGEYAGQEKEVTLKALSAPEQTSYGWRFDAKILQPARAKVRIYLFGGEPPAIGDPVQMRIAFSDPGEAVSPGFTRALRSKGILLSGAALSPAKAAGEGGFDLETLPARVRAYADARSDALFGRGSPVIRALFFGGQAGFSPELSKAASDTGLAHIFAVSGTNLSFFAGLVLLLGRRSKFVNILAMLSILAFMAVSGFPPSVCRAGIMQLAALTAFLLGREGDSFSALCLSLLLLLLLNPYAVADIGLQFSYLAVLGLLTLGRQTEEFLKRRIRPGDGGAKSRIRIGLLSSLAAAGAATFSAQIFTVPLTMLYFGRMSLVALISNLLALWAVSGTFFLGAAAVGLSLIWMPLALPFAFLARAGAWYIENLTLFLGSLPVSAVGTENPVFLLWAAFAYAAGIFFFVFRKGLPGAGGAKGPGRSGLLRIFTPGRQGAAKAALLISLSFFLALGSDAAGNYQRAVFEFSGPDRGGFSIVSWRGKTVVIDCGSPGSDGASLLCDRLGARNITKIDFLILTSLRPSSASGAAGLLELGMVKNIVLPARAGDEDSLAALLEAAEENSVRAVEITADTVISAGAMSFHIMIPPSPDSDKKGFAAVLACAGGGAALFLGALPVEAQEYMLETREIPKLLAVVAGDSGTSAKILSACAPEYVIIEHDRAMAGLGDADGLRLLRLWEEGRAALWCARGRVHLR